MPTPRPAAVHDWSALWPLLVGMGTSQEEPAARATFAELRADPRWLLLVVESDAGLAGYAAAQDHGPRLRSGEEHRTARLHDLFVRPDERGRGVGRALVDAVVAWADGRVRYLEWQAHEQRAAPFYARLGYRGEPCPQPEYPTFEIDFDPPRAEAAPRARG